MKKKLLIFVRKYWQFCTFVVIFSMLKLLSVVPHSDLLLLLPYPAFVFCFCYFVFYKGLQDLDIDAKKVTRQNRLVFFAKFLGCWIVLGVQFEYFMNIRNGFGFGLFFADQMVVLLYLFVGMFFVKLIQVGKQNYNAGDGLYWVMFPIWYSMAVMYPMLFLRWLVETFVN